jgi:hypothetical protein
MTLDSTVPRANLFVQFAQTIQNPNVNFYEVPRNITVLIQDSFVTVSRYSTDGQGSFGRS